MYMCRIDGPDGQLEGIIEVHLDVHGEECVGGVPFNMLRKPNWTCKGWWPDITVAPSIQCTRCMNHHGWIRDGKWIAA